MWLVVRNAVALKGQRECGGGIVDLWEEGGRKEGGSEGERGTVTLLGKVKQKKTD